MSAARAQFRGTEDRYASDKYGCTEQLIALLERFLECKSERMRTFVILLGLLFAWFQATFSTMFSTDYLKQCSAISFEVVVNLG